MSKIVMQNVIVNAKSGGTIRNYDSVEISDSELNFEEESINFETDERVAILKSMIESIDKKDLLELATKLQLSPVEQHQEILKGSKLKKALALFNSVKPVVDWVLGLINDGA